MREIGELKTIITNTIGFNFEPKELQTVNADDLLRLASAFSNILSAEPQSNNGQPIETKRVRRMERALKLISSATCIVYDEDLNTMVEVAMDEEQMANIAREAITHVPASHPSPSPEIEKGAA